MNSQVRLRRLGRHGERHDIEPSCGVLDLLDGSRVTRRIVVDCGAEQRRDGAIERWSIPDLATFDGGPPIDGVFVTHAHQDHMGGLPALVPFLTPTARFFMTRPTALAVRHMFRKELDEKKRPGRAKRPYTKAQLAEALRRIEEIGPAGEHEPLAGLPTLVWPAGHISGACSFTFRVGGKTFHYSGDRCDHDQPSVLGALPLPDDWRPDVVAGSDCTYGGGPDPLPDWQDEMDRLSELCWEALSNRRRIFLFTFALHRAGVIAHELQRQGLADAHSVFLDGAGCDYAALYQTGSHRWCDRDQPLHIDRVGQIHDQRGRQAVADLDDGYVIIGTPGMGGPGGVGTWWRKIILPDPDAIVAFTGYVAHGTDGEQILAADAVRRHGKMVPDLVFRETDRQGQIEEVTVRLRCQVEHYRLGGHNRQADTVQWFQDLAPRTAVLSHGSLDSLDYVESRLLGSGIEIVRADRQPVWVVDL